MKLEIASRGGAVSIAGNPREIAAIAELCAAALTVYRGGVDEQRSVDLCASRTVRVASNGKERRVDTVDFRIRVAPEN